MTNLSYLAELSL